MIPDRHALQAIADMIGFGHAQARVRSMGFWDEYAGEGEPREYHVTISAEIRQTISAYVTVRARSEAEARHLAETKASEGRITWDLSNDPDDWKIIEILQADP